MQFQGIRKVKMETDPLGEQQCLRIANKPTLREHNMQTKKGASMTPLFQIVTAMALNILFPAG